MKGPKIHKIRLIDRTATKKLRNATALAKIPILGRKKY